MNFVNQYNPSRVSAATLNGFGFTTREAARSIGTSVEAMRAQFQRTGTFRGLAPVRVNNGRLIWPRAEVLALTGLITAPTNPKAIVDLRATLPWLETLGIPTNDPVALALSIALNLRVSDPASDTQELLDFQYALRAFNEAANARIAEAHPRMTAEERTGVARLQALAVADTVAGLEPDVLRRAVADAMGCGA
jgi:hypothetical protein